jgi:type II secretory pathway pseudopilin PulG
VAAEVESDGCGMLMRRRGEHGETLAEVLVSTTLLGIIGIGLIGAIAAVLISTDVDRKTSQAETVLRSYVAAVQDASYEAGGGTYSGVFTPPEKFTATVEQVRCWDGTGPTVVPAADGVTTLQFGSCADDNGLQRIDLRVASTTGRASEHVTIFKRNTVPS